MHALAQEGLQPGVWDLGQALPLLHRRPWALCRRQCSPAGVLQEEPHRSSQWDGDDLQPGRFP